MAAKKQDEKKSDQPEKPAARAKTTRPKAEPTAPEPVSQQAQPPQAEPPKPKPAPAPAKEPETTGEKVKRVAKTALKKIAAAAMDALEAESPIKGKGTAKKGEAKEPEKKGAEKKPAPVKETAAPPAKAAEKPQAAKPAASAKPAPEPKPARAAKPSPPPPTKAPAPASSRRRTAGATQASAASEPGESKTNRPGPRGADTRGADTRGAEPKVASTEAQETPLPPSPRGVSSPEGTEPGGVPSPQQGPAALGREETEYAVERSRLVLMVRDPEWLFAYWTIADDDREQHRIGQPQGAPPLILHIMDLGLAIDPQPGENFFDITVIDDARGWYVHLPHSGGQWQASLGFLDEQGELMTLCLSNTVNVPSQAMILAGEVEEPWGPMLEEIGEMEFQPTGVMAPAGARPDVLLGDGGEYHQALRALIELTRGGASEQLLRPGASEQLLRLRPGASEQVPLRPGASEQVYLRPGASEQLGAPGSGLRPEQRGAVEVEVARGFWLQVYTELIVYGATEADAKVTVQGIPIRLRPDGTFTLRFALPDGEQVIPVRAIKVDDSEERTITPIVTKRTE